MRRGTARRGRPDPTARRGSGSDPNRWSSSRPATQRRTPCRKRYKTGSRPESVSSRTGTGSPFKDGRSSTGSEGVYWSSDSSSRRPLPRPYFPQCVRISVIHFLRAYDGDAHAHETPTSSRLEPPGQVLDSPRPLWNLPGRDDPCRGGNLTRRDDGAWHGSRGPVHQFDSESLGPHGPRSLLTSRVR